MKKEIQSYLELATTPDDSDLNDLVKLASLIFKMPMSIVTLMDNKTQRIGLHTPYR